MKAFRLRELGAPAAWADAPDPRLAPDGVVLEVQAAGICVSDLHLQAPGFPFPPAVRQWQMPMTLGHEVAGRIIEVGSGVTNWNVGDEVFVGSSVSGCNACWHCSHAATQACQGPPVKFCGLGIDGGMTSQIAVPVLNLVACNGLTAAICAPLADSGATAVRAVRTAEGVLTGGPVVTVIGIGGIGHFAIGYLKATTGCTVVAIDNRETSLDLATEMGADHTILMGENAYGEYLDVVRGEHSAAVIDCAGTAQSVALANKVVRPAGELVLIGMADGVFTVGPDTKPGVRATLSFASSRADVIEVRNYVDRGLIKPSITTFPMSDLELVFQKLATNQLVGRWVGLPAELPPAT